MASPKTPKPSQPTNHGRNTAEANAVRSNLVKPGRFGLLFPELASSPWTTGDPAKDEQVAVELGKAMHAPGQKIGVIPAGFTYFGQFVDHDITFDPTSLGENAVDVDDLTNFRTPALDLDNLYGSGPRDQPFLYRRDSSGTASQFLIGPVIQPGRRRARRHRSPRSSRRMAPATTCRAPATACPNARRSSATSATTRT